MDRTPPTHLPQDPAERPNWLRRIGWLALIWAGSVVALFVVAMLFRGLMGWAGLTTPAS